MFPPRAMFPESLKMLLLFQLLYMNNDYRPRALRLMPKRSILFFIKFVLDPPQVRHYYLIMTSPRSPKLSAFESHDSLFMKKTPTEIYDERLKSQNQLSNFYMPYLKKIYQDNKSAIPSLRPPEELVFNSRLLEMRENQLKKRLQITIKDNQLKQQKIRQLSSKVMILTQRLKIYEPSIENQMDLPFNSFSQTQKDIKRLQNLHKIKNQENFFSLKMKAMSLLEEFNVERADIEGIHHIDTEGAVFEFMLSKLKGKVKEIRAKSQTINVESGKDKMIHNKLEQQVRFLSDTNQMVRNSERKLKEKLQDVKKQWSQSNQRLIQKEKENQAMDLELFRLKRLLEQKEGLLIKYSSQIHNKTMVADDLRLEYEQQVRDQRALLNSYNIQINQLKQQLEWKSGELEELRIDHNLKVHQNQKVHREYIRWKDRYQNYEREKEEKFADAAKYIEISKALEEENATLKQQIRAYRFSEPVTPATDMFDTKGHDRIIEMLKNEVISKSEEVQRLNLRIRRLEEELSAKDVGTRESSLVIERRYQQLMKEREESYKRAKEQLISGWNESKQRYESEISDYQKQIRFLQSQLSKRQQKFQSGHHKPQEGLYSYKPAAVERKGN